jgi:hypothetical protein
MGQSYYPRTAEVLVAMDHAWVVLSRPARRQDGLRRSEEVCVKAKLSECGCGSSRRRPNRQPSR